MLSENLFLYSYILLFFSVLSTFFPPHAITGHFFPSLHFSSLLLLHAIRELFSLSILFSFCAINFFPLHAITGHFLPSLHFPLIWLFPLASPPINTTFSLLPLTCSSEVCWISCRAFSMASRVPITTMSSEASFGLGTWILVAVFCSSSCRRLPFLPRTKRWWSCVGK